MRYLVVTENEEPFFSNWFQPENHFVKGMKVFDILLSKYTVNGIDWNEIQIDHL